MNPWEGTDRAWMGEPEKTCPGFCYVDCASDKCEDKMDAKGEGRCWSKRGCENING